MTTKTTTDPETLLAVRLAVRYGQLPIHWQDSAVRSLQRRGLLDETCRPTAEGFALARTKAAQRVHSCERCKVGAAVREYEAPRGDEWCPACERWLRQEVRQSRRSTITDAARSLGGVAGA